MSTALY